MYPILNKLLSDKEHGHIFTCFDIWHWFYIILTAAAVVTLCMLLKNRGRVAKERTLKILSGIGFGLYMADVFLMPFAYGEIDVDKLPFHACTALCIMCFLSNRNEFLKKYRVHFALFAFISNLMYLVYPAGVMWSEVTPYSYRAIQTLLFHSSMTVYCLCAMILDEEGPKIKKSYNDLILLAVMTVWAFIGNTLYSGKAGDYDRDFNWFFIKEDPFELVSEKIAPYILPFINIAAFFAIEVIIYLIFAAVRNASKRSALC